MLCRQFWNETTIVKHIFHYSRKKLLVFGDIYTRHYGGTKQDLKSSLHPYSFSWIGGVLISSC
jgi:hypothetical protein